MAEWKEFNFEGKDPAFNYQVSDEGKVRLEQSEAWKTIRVSKQKNGYAYCRFRRKGGAYITKSMHRVVAMLFCEKASGTEFVVHEDYNKSNNVAKNLKWVNKAQLLAHKKESPNVIRANVNRNGLITNAKLSPKQVSEIRLLLESKELPNYVIAHKFGISETQLQRIKNKSAWTNL